MNRLLLIIATIFLTLTSYTYKAQNTDWAVVSSNISFKIKNAGFNVDGKFGALTATIVLMKQKYPATLLKQQLIPKQ